LQARQGRWGHVRGPACEHESAPPPHPQPLSRASPALPRPLNRRDRVAAGSMHGGTGRVAHAARRARRGAARRGVAARGLIHCNISTARGAANRRRAARLPAARPPQAQRTFAVLDLGRNAPCAPLRSERAEKRAGTQLLPQPAGRRRPSVIPGAFEAQGERGRAPRRGDLRAWNSAGAREAAPPSGPRGPGATGCARTLRGAGGAARRRERAVRCGGCGAGAHAPPPWAALAARRTTPTPALRTRTPSPAPRRRPMARRTASGARRAGGLLLAALLAAAAAPRARAAAVKLTVTTGADGGLGREAAEV
jgi:hypothetical protein